MTDVKIPQGTITMEHVAERARASSRELRRLDGAEKNRCIERMADALLGNRQAIEAANALDLDAPLPEAKRERLRVDVDGIARSLRDIAKLPDPIGATKRARPTVDFDLVQKRVPIGVILMIFESRPNVTPEAGALCLKSGNASILKGGSEARHTNQAMMAVMREAFPVDAIQLVSGGHEAIDELLELDGLIDLVIPRGGEGLIRAVAERSRIPVLKHYRGNCHVYVDQSAELDMAYAILENGKCQRPATCNAVEKLLVHDTLAERFIPRLSEMGVLLKGDERSRAILAMEQATEEDWPEEYLDLTLAVKVVADIGEAIDHIERYGSHHTDAIVTEDPASAERFLEEVDSATVLWNASPRLADGGIFGLGAEVGISTDKLHARGPMGLEELTTYKWIARGKGTLRP